MTHYFLWYLWCGFIDNFWHAGIPCLVCPAWHIRLLHLQCWKSLWLRRRQLSGGPRLSGRPQVWSGQLPRPRSWHGWILLCPAGQLHPQSPRECEEITNPVVCLGTLDLVTTGLGESEGESLLAGRRSLWGLWRQAAGIWLDMQESGYWVHFLFLVRSLVWILSTFLIVS